MLPGVASEKNADDGVTNTATVADDGQWDILRLYSFT